MPFSNWEIGVAVVGTVLEQQSQNQFEQGRTLGPTPQNDLNIITTFWMLALLPKFLAPLWEKNRNDEMPYLAHPCGECCTSSGLMVANNMEVYRPRTSGYSTTVVEII
jgi:hypothetical protein